MHKVWGSIKESDNDYLIINIIEKNKRTHTCNYTHYTPHTHTTVKVKKKKRWSIHKVKCSYIQQSQNILLNCVFLGGRWLGEENHHLSSLMSFLPTNSLFLSQTSATSQLLAWAPQQLLFSLILVLFLLVQLTSIDSPFLNSYAPLFLDSQCLENWWHGASSHFQKGDWCFETVNWNTYIPIHPLGSVSLENPKNLSLALWT